MTQPKIDGPAIRAACLALAALLAARGLAQAQSPPRARIEMELVFEDNAQAADNHRWYQLLTELGVDSLRIRSGRGGERPAVTSHDSGAAVTYRVLGILARDGGMIVPGMRFAASDRAKISGWLSKLRTVGPAQASGQPRPPFGMQPEQLSQVQEDLSQPVDFVTLDMSAAGVLGRIAGRLRHQLLADPGVFEQAARITMTDELKGLSFGTALAIAVRPLGMVVEPRTSADRRPQYVVTSPKAGGEHWPIGWPPDKRSEELAPKLMEVIDTQLDKAALAQVLSIVGQRIELPMIWDHVALARHGIDPSAAAATLPASKMAYATILSRALFQAGLRYELRIDDAGRPFLWITTIKPV